MSIKVACVLAGLIGTALLAVMPAAWGVSWWVRVLLPVPIALFVLWRGRLVLLGGVAFEEIAYSVRSRMVTALGAAIVLHTAWVVLVAIGPLAWWHEALALILLSVVEWLVALDWEFRVTRVKRPQNPSSQVVVHEAELVDDAPTGYDNLGDQALGTAVLAAMGFSHYVVLRPDPDEQCSPGVAVWVCQKLTPFAHAQRLYDAAVRRAKADDKDWQQISFPEVKDLPTLTHKHSEDIGNVIMSLTGVEMGADFVEVAKHRVAGRVIITAATSDIGQNALPYTALDATARDPRRMVIGLAKRGTEVTVNPCQHWKLIGATGSGKSGAENVWMAEDLVRGHRVILCGAAKVWDLGEEWVENLGDCDMPIKIVQGLGDTLRVLVAVCRFASWKQTLPAAQRAGIAPVRVAITESSRVMVDRSMTIHWEGRDWTAGELIGHIGRSYQGADVWLLLSAQDFDHDYWGTEAASIKNNTGGTLLVRSRNADERRRALGDSYYGLPDLQHPGETYAKDNGAPVYVKLFYPQESDPSKPRLHDGPTVSQIAYIRARQAAHFTSEELRVMGEWFATLPTRMTPDFRDYLRGLRSLSPITEDASARAPHQRTNDLLAEVDAMLAAAGALPVGALPAPATGPEPEVVGVPQHVPLRDRIVQLVEQAGQLGRKELVAALLAEGYETSQQSVDNALSALAKPNGGRLKRHNDTAGVYLPAHASPSLTSPTPTPVTAGGGATQR
jgi:hypothetical protein